MAGGSLSRVFSRAVLTLRILSRPPRRDGQAHVARRSLGLLRPIAVCGAGSVLSGGDRHATAAQSISGLWGLSSSGTESRIERVILVQERCGRMPDAWPRPR
jgi:hypothetical protein